MRLKPVGFDEIDTSGSTGGSVLVPYPYHHVAWASMNVQDTSDARFDGSGFDAGTTSGSQVAYSTDREAIIHSDDGTFDFSGGELTAAWSIGLKVTVIGELNFNSKYHTEITLTDAHPLDFKVHWTGIDRVEFLVGHDTPDPNVSGHGRVIVFDDLLIGHYRASDRSVDLSAAAGAVANSSHLLGAHSSMFHPEAHQIA